MNRSIRITAAALAAFSVVALGSCDIFSGLQKPADSGAAVVRFLEPGSGEVDLSLYAASGRSAYVVFTTGKTSTSEEPAAEAKASFGGRAPLYFSSARGSGEEASERRREKFRDSLERYVPAMARRLSPSGGDPAGDAEGNPGSFKVAVMAGGVDTLQDIQATCRKVVGPVDIGGRTRTLSVWVADDCWEPTGSTKQNEITPGMVDALARAFFGAESARSSSIYAWVTAMLGPEWGAGGSVTYRGRPYPTIGASDNVTILLADIYEQDTDSGGVVGYFYSGDTIVGQEDSNERVMFAIDAVMYASQDGEGGSSSGAWDAEDDWPKIVVSTLAHEFQHMVHFYQKGVVAGADLYLEPTWIDEMCSMQVEDLLSDKLGVPGPRGVAPGLWTAGSAANGSGRLPDYLQYPDISLEKWGKTNIYASYAIAYAFGAYMTRNYGGAEFVRRVVQSASPSDASVVDAAAAASGASEPMETLLRRWGAAVLLSGRTDAPERLRYNTGEAFSSTVGGVEYKLGSINVWNYAASTASGLRGLYLFKDGDFGSFVGGPLSNAFMDLGDPSGKPRWTVTVPEGMYATVVID